MYLGIDIGGTKTLIATLDDQGKILEQTKFPTAKDYDQFLADLKQNLASLNLDADIKCCAGVPGLIDRKTGVVHALGNLPWQDKPIQDDIASVVGYPVIIENDARLAGLSEAQLVRDRYETILFATVSTGIGGALIQNGQIVTALEDIEMGKMPLWHDGQYRHWEDFAGGRSVVERYGMIAAEITDPAQWQEIAELLAVGFGPACAIMQPDAIILGGSVGKQAAHYKDALMQSISQQAHVIVRPPQAILAAGRPDEAVIYGCYTLAAQRHA